jgi:hypothetical protein
MDGNLGFKKKCFITSINYRDVFEFHIGVVGVFEGVDEDFCNREGSRISIIVGHKSEDVVNVTFCTNNDEGVSRVKYGAYFLYIVN